MSDNCKKTIEIVTPMWRKISLEILGHLVGLQIQIADTNFRYKFRVLQIQIADTNCNTNFYILQIRMYLIQIADTNFYILQIRMYLIQIADTNCNTNFYILQIRMYLIQIAIQISTYCRYVCI